MTSINRKGRKFFDAVLRKRNKSIVDSINDDTQKLWNQAYENTQWLVGDPITTPDGQQVDFSMMDFLVATMPPIKETESFLQVLQKFWINAYPYIESLTGNLNFYKEKFKEVYGIEGETLKNYALQNLELQCYKKFMAEELDICCDSLMGAEDIRKQFSEYHAKFKDESDKEIEKIKAKEEKWLEEQEKKEAHRAENRKREAFHKSLLS